MRFLHQPPPASQTTAVIFHNTALSNATQGKNFQPLLIMEDVVASCHKSIAPG